MMSSHGVQADVESFHALHGQIDPLTPSSTDGATLQLRIDLITEEFDELIDELVKLQVDALHTTPKIAELDRLAHIAKEIADLIYVSVGTASVLGIDIAPVWEAVHESNMKKADGPLRLDGKRLKPPDWKPPNIVAIIREQQAESDFSTRAITPIQAERVQAEKDTAEQRAIAKAARENA